MGIYTVKSQIRDYISSQIFIDEWGVKAPLNIPKIIDGVYYPSVAAIIAPFSSYTLGTDSLVIVNCESRFQADICWRFNGEASFEELPINIIENLVDWVFYHPVARPNLFGDICYQVIVDNKENPVMISRTDSEDRDWLIYGLLEWVVSFRSKPINPNDLGVIQPVIPTDDSIIITSIGIKTYKEMQSDTIDKEIMIPG